MNIVETKLPGVLIIEPKVFRDHRGMFYETYRQEHYAEIGINELFVQDNYSQLKHGVIAACIINSNNRKVN